MTPFSPSSGRLQQVVSSDPLSGGDHDPVAVGGNRRGPRADAHDLWLVCLPARPDQTDPAFRACHKESVPVEGEGGHGVRGQPTQRELFPVPGEPKCLASGSLAPPPPRGRIPDGHRFPVRGQEPPAGSVRQACSRWRCRGRPLSSGVISDADKAVGVDTGQSAVRARTDVTDRGGEGKRRRAGKGADLLPPGERTILLCGGHRPAHVRRFIQLRGVEPGRRSGRRQPVSAGVRGDEPVVAEPDELMYPAVNGLAGGQQCGRPAAVVVQYTPALGARHRTAGIPRVHGHCGDGVTVIGIGHVGAGLPDSPVNDVASLSSNEMIVIEERGEAAGALAADLLGLLARLADEQELLSRKRQQAAWRPGQGSDFSVRSIGTGPARARAHIGQADNAHLAIGEAESELLGHLVECRHDRFTWLWFELTPPVPAPIRCGHSLGHPAISPCGPERRIFVEAQGEGPGASSRPP